MRWDLCGSSGHRRGERWSCMAAWQLPTVHWSGATINTTRRICHGFPPACTAPVSIQVQRTLRTSAEALFRQGVVPTYAARRRGRRCARCASRGTAVANFGCQASTLRRLSACVPRRRAGRRFQCSRTPHRRESSCCGTTATTAAAGAAAGLCTPLRWPPRGLPGRRHQAAV